MDAENLPAHAVGPADGLSIIDRPSPNFGPRRGGATPSLVVLHYTGMASTEAALHRLCTAEFEVSAHYLVDETGRILRLVGERMRAWHAGQGEWGGVADVNSRSLGIEIANPGNRPFAEAQMMSLESLLRSIMRRWRISPQAVIGHSDMAPGRKVDPGRRFDWRRLARQGLSVWPDPAAPMAADAGRFARAALQFGYPRQFATRQAGHPEVLLQAYRQRFRPWARGPLDAADMSGILDLANRFPAD